MRLFQNQPPNASLNLAAAGTAGDCVEITIADVAHGGDGLGRIDGEVVFVPGVLPGERVMVSVERQKRDYARATLVSVVEPAAERVIPRCAHFGVCGGCQWQHAAYGAQLEIKRRTMVEQLRRIGRFPNAEDLVAPVIGMVEPWEYRNHARFTLGRKYGDVGYTYKGTRRLLPIDHCHIVHPKIDEIRNLVQRRCPGQRANQIMVRYGCNTGELLVSPALPQVSEVASGQVEMAEEILDRRFLVSAAAFFQVNTKREKRALPDPIRAPWLTDRTGDYSIADLLALMVLDRIDPQPDEVVLDAYCGVGTFAALVSPLVGRVVGIEESPAAIKDATRNTRDLANATFITGKVEHVVGSLDERRLAAVILDPARAGCAPAVVEALVAARPARIVYVSCDPATLARDLRAFCDGGYDVQSVEPLDMFAQTHHIESVTTLRAP